MGKKVTLLALPCCCEQTLTEQELIEHNLKLVMDAHDWNVHSEKNRILIWAENENENPKN